jgi:hypothetical protein
MAVNLSISSSNKIGRFSVKLFFFVVILSIVDLIGGTIFGHFFYQTKYGENWPKANWVIGEQFDIVILGSSRTFRHYVPGIITEETNLSVFNAGENGQYLLYAYALEQLILEKYKPKIIVLDLLPSYTVALDNPELEFNRLDVLAPYSGNKKVRELLIGDSFYQKIKLLCKLYRYNSRILNIADNIRNGPENFDNGYISIGQPKFRETNQFLVDKMANPSFDEYKKEILNQFILSASEKQIPIVFSFSPTLQPLSDIVMQKIKEYKAIAQLHNIHFVEFGPDEFPEYMNKEYFMDYIHMNAKGAEKFSKEFGHKLKPILNTINVN